MAKKCRSDFSGSTIAMYKGFIGKAVLSTRDLIHSQCISFSEGSYSQGSGPLVSQALTQISIPIPRAAIENPLYLGHSAKASLRPLCGELFIRGERKALKDTFFYSDSERSTFPFLAPLPCPHAASRSIQLQALPVQGSIHNKMIPIFMLIHLFSR